MAGKYLSPAAFIPPLPDDVSVACLSRLSLWDLAVARCVSRGWAAAIASDAFLQQRREQALGAQHSRVLPQDVGSAAVRSSGHCAHGEAFPWPLH
ncbi:hypothetical protein CLOM_g9800 [Closterium sp. NIES-68]|nr:hypothetical protein CLOM_g9800 [Closterium sp. NIES-68]